MPTPRNGERPVDFADRVGEMHVVTRPNKQRKELGLFLTPVVVADFMASQITTRKRAMRVLDPAAGAGVLCCAAIEALVARNRNPQNIEVVAFEIDKGLIAPLQAVLNYLSGWCEKHHRVTVNARVESEDFVLRHAQALRPQELFPARRAAEPFDVIIANPPYFKIGKDDPRAIAMSDVVHGQPNIYSLFMAAGATMLRQHGDFVFITPRSFVSGPYFRRFREAFFKMIRPTGVHVFDCRRCAFRRDAVLQENVILLGTREDGWLGNGVDAHLKISSSRGTEDIGAARMRDVPLRTALESGSKDMILRLPAGKEAENVLDLIDSWPSSLSDQGLRVSTGPVVPFRASEFVASNGSVPTSHAPLLWMSHVRPMQARWPIDRHKPEYIARSGAERLLVPNRNYVLMRRFSAKEEQRRLTAAPYIASKLATPDIGLENHLNYIHRPRGELSVDEAWGLAALFSSQLLDTWFRTINGNTQVSATELRAMRLPAHEAIVSLGRRIRAMRDPVDSADGLVTRMFIQSKRRTATVG